MGLNTLMLNGLPLKIAKTRTIRYHNVDTGNYELNFPIFILKQLVCMLLLMVVKFHLVTKDYVYHW